jgi:serine/threonine protein kinase
MQSYQHVLSSSCQKCSELHPGINSSVFLGRMGNLNCLTNSSNTYFSKQDVTIWNYQEPANPVGHPVRKNDLVTVIDKSGKWWKVTKDDITGYASKYYFAKSGSGGYLKEPWYFGAMTREDCHELLDHKANPEGSYLVRWSSNAGQFVLGIRLFEMRQHRYYYKHFDVKFEQGKYFFVTQKRFSSLSGLINMCSKNKEDGLPVKLTNISIIPNPHSDPRFVHASRGQDSWLVPLSELRFEKNANLGEGEFGKVCKAKFRGTLDVAVKQLKVDGAHSDRAKKLLDDFFAESELMSKLNHPNLVQMFAYVSDSTKGNFMIQEFMAKGDLKNYLGQIKREKKENSEGKFEILLKWCQQVALGMEHLQRVSIVHRDLAARNVLLDEFNRAKVADFGLALDNRPVNDENTKLPVKWTAPECLETGKNFSHWSDVWAFGILMWEVFTFGEMPYPGVRNSEYKGRLIEEYHEYLARRNGSQGRTRTRSRANRLRCNPPKSRQGEEVQMKNTYNVMLSCWEIVPENRMDFGRLREELAHFGYQEFD